MKNKHTPAPWHLIETSSMVKNGDVTLMLANKSPHIHGVLYGVKNDADAYLIAAAPELLEALEYIFSCVTCNGDMKSEINLRGDDINIIAKAIAKAKGE